MHIISFVRGVALGFIAGVLFAPDSGATTRRKLAEYASAVKDNLEEAFDDLAGAFGRKRNAESKAEEIMDRNEPGYSNLTGYAGTL
jgi:gas vesicle protein